MSRSGEDYWDSKRGCFFDGYVGKIKADKKNYYYHCDSRHEPRVFESTMGRLLAAIFILIMRFFGYF